MGGNYGISPKIDGSRYPSHPHVEHGSQAVVVLGDETRIADPDSEAHLAIAEVGYGVQVAIGFVFGFLERLDFRLSLVWVLEHLPVWSLCILGFPVWLLLTLRQFDWGSRSVIEETAG